MDDALFLGIDGGGTTTRARLATPDGRVLGEATAGSSNLTSGVEAAAAAIRAAADGARTAAGLGPDSLGHVRAGFGLAGANVPSLAEGLRRQSFPFASVALASDAVVACLGAHGGGDGGILIVGTGSQGMAIVGGRATPIGGWGFAVGDDASGAILGRAAIRAAVAAFDGLAPRSALTDALMATFGDDPSRVVEWALSARPKDYGGLVPQVLAHAAQADAVALALLDEAVAAAAAMLDRLRALGASRLCLMGGLAAAYLPRLPARLAPFIVQPVGDAMDGALALARGGAPA